mgnify:CR=1 FL=1
MNQPLHVPPGTPICLADFSAKYVETEVDKTEAKLQTKRNIKRLAELGHQLYAENQRAVLVVLQGMDTAGKDGTIRALMRGLNPQSCRVTSFKAPSAEELDHDFLWRIHRAVPRRGNIGIFNRSQYEDVLIVRVHSIVAESEWKSRYDRINDFERLLTEGGVTIVKCYLHISKDEQRQRLQDRVNTPHKRWKFNPADLKERLRWHDYQLAYNDALTRCNTEHAPWHIIPADRKWYRNLVVSRLLVQTLESLDPQFPAAGGDWKDVVVE